MNCSLNEEDIQGNQLSLYILAKIMSNKSIITQDDVIVICCYVSWCQASPGHPWSPASWGCPGSAPWHRTGKCERRAPWPRSLRGLERSLSLCCQPGGNVVKTLITQWTGETVREKPVCRSHSSLTHPMPSRPAPVCHRSHKTSHWSRFVNPGTSLARRKCHCQESWVFDSDRLKVNLKKLKLHFVWISHFTFPSFLSICD